MFITTFKTTLDLVDTHNNPVLFNLPPTLENLDVLFFNTQYGLWVWNTVLVGILVVIITLLLAIPAGYSLARLRSEERRVGKGVSVRVDLGGRRLIKQKNKHKKYDIYNCCRSKPKIIGVIQD